jgi:hypothetical protein
MLVVKQRRANQNSAQFLLLASNYSSSRVIFNILASFSSSRAYILLKLVHLSITLMR